MSRLPIGSITVETQGLHLLSRTAPTSGDGLDNVLHWHYWGYEGFRKLQCGAVILTKLWSVVLAIFVVLFKLVYYSSHSLVCLRWLLTISRLASLCFVVVSFIFGVMRSCILRSFAISNKPTDGRTDTGFDLRISYYRSWSDPESEHGFSMT